MYTFWIVKMPNLTAGYGRLSDLNTFFCEFSYVITCLKLYQFFTNCVFGKKCRDEK